MSKPGHRAIGRIVAFSIKYSPIVVVLWLYLARPRLWLEKGGYYFAVVSLLGVLFLKFAPDQKTWNKLSLLILTIVWSIGFLLLSLYILQSSEKIGASVSLLFYIPIATLIYAVEFRSVISSSMLSPNEGETLVEYKRKFYEWLWLVSAGLGVLCDTLNHLSHQH